MLHLLILNSNIIKEVKIPDDALIERIRLFKDTLVFIKFKRIEGNGKIYVQLYDRTFGPYDEMLPLRCSNSREFFREHFEDDIRECPESFWFISIREDKFYVHIKDKVFGPFDPGPGGILVPQFSPNKSKYAFNFKKGDKYYIQLNERTFGPFDKPAHFGFSSDGSKFWMVFSQGGKYYVRINDKIFGPCSKVYKIYSSKSDYLIVI